MGGSRKQEMRDCKGIKILLVICPSSHRSEDLLPQPEVFWNLSLSCVSFLLSLFSLSWFPARWASCHFPCAGFSLHSASICGSFCQVGLLLFLASASGGWAEVVSAGLNLRNGTIAVGGVCNFLGSVLSQQWQIRSVLQPCEIRGPSFVLF